MSKYTLEHRTTLFAIVLTRTLWMKGAEILVLRVENRFDEYGNEFVVLPRL